MMKPRSVVYVSYLIDSVVTRNHDERTDRLPIQRNHLDPCRPVPLWLKIGARDARGRWIDPGQMMPTVLDELLLPVSVLENPICCPLGKREYVCRQIRSLLRETMVLHSNRVHE